MAGKYEILQMAALQVCSFAFTPQPLYNTIAGIQSRNRVSKITMLYRNKKMYIYEEMNMIFVDFINVWMLQITHELNIKPLM